jgi:hypothetical protein
MADKKISALTASTTPLAGTEVLPIVQGGSTVKVSVANLTAGRAPSMSGATLQNVAPVLNFVTTAGEDITGYVSNAIDVGSGGKLIFGTKRNGNTTLDRVSINAAGDMSLLTSNLVIGTAGKGIDFSAATHAAGMTSELLNDYEEGTFTPVLSSSGVAPTVTSYSTQYGSYTKIGNRVFVTVAIRATMTVAGTGYPVITGMPYAAAGTCNNGPAWGLATILNIGINGSFISGTTIQLSSSSYSIVNDYCCFSIMYEI